MNVKWQHLWPSVWIIAKINLKNATQTLTL